MHIGSSIKFVPLDRRKSQNGGTKRGLLSFGLIQHKTGKKLSSFYANDHLCSLYNLSLNSSLCKHVANVLFPYKRDSRRLKCFLSKCIFLDFQIKL